VRPLSAHNLREEQSAPLRSGRSSGTRRTLLLALCTLCFLPAATLAQSTQTFPSNDTQVWSSFPTQHRLKENVDLSLNAAFRWSADAGHLVYERVGAGLDFRWHRYITFSPEYRFYSRDITPAEEARENRISLGATVDIPLGAWRLSDRNLGERRFLVGRDTWRYRNRLRLERRVKLLSTSLALFVWDEVFFDGGADAWTRNRLAIGGGKSISERVAVDLYYLRQNDSYTRPGDLNTIGITVRTRF
jgi:hypothetical protein